MIGFIMPAVSHKKSILVMESGSFKTFGGAVKDSHRLYVYLKSLGKYKIDFFADFSKFGEHPPIALDEMYKTHYDLIIINSMRDVLLLKKYMPKNTSTKTIYVDRGDIVYHYFTLPGSRAISRLAGIFPISADMSDSMSKSIIKSTNSIALKHARDFFSKGYGLYLFKEMRKWLTCYIAINAEQELRARKFFISKTMVKYIPIAPHEEFTCLHIKKDFEGGIFIGRLEETQKRVSLLIQGIKEVVRMHPELKGRELLRIYGTGPDEGYYKQLVKELALESSISFRGFALESKLLHAYNDAGFFVSSSYWEGLSRVFLEAMACGLPVLANTKNNRLIDYKKRKYLVRENKNGLIFEYGNMSDFAKKFYLLYSDKKLAKSLGNNAQKLISKELNIKKMLASYDALISGLLS